MGGRVGSHHSMQNVRRINIASYSVRRPTRDRELTFRFLAIMTFRIFFYFCCEKEKRWLRVCVRILENSNRGNGIIRRVSDARLCIARHTAHTYILEFPRQAQCGFFLFFSFSASSLWVSKRSECSVLILLSAHVRITESMRSAKPVVCHVRLHWIRSSIAIRNAYFIASTQSFIQSFWRRRQHGTLCSVATEG